MARVPLCGVTYQACKPTTRQSYCTAVQALPSEVGFGCFVQWKKKRFACTSLTPSLCSRRSSQLQLRPATEPRDLPTLRRRFPGNDSICCVHSNLFGANKHDSCVEEPNAAPRRQRTDRNHGVGSARGQGHGPRPWYVCSPLARLVFSRNGEEKERKTCMSCLRGN